MTTGWRHAGDEGNGEQSSSQTMTTANDNNGDNIVGPQPGDNDDNDRQSQTMTTANVDDAVGP